jgi:hypothetical protein
MSFIGQLITPFTKTRVNRVKRSHAKIRSNADKIRTAREDRDYVKQLKKDGVLK